MEIERQKRGKSGRWAVVVVAAILVVSGIGVWVGMGFVQQKKRDEQAKIEAEKKEKERIAGIRELVRMADKLAASYDYDAAIEKIKSFGEDYTKHAELTRAISSYEVTKEKTVRFSNTTRIPHIFFHTLIVDTAKTFDGDAQEGGYNQYMTTIAEFRAILDELYKRDFVLVNIYDVAREVKQSNGKMKFEQGDIMLPDGKKPIVMSQDDVNYYNYMKGDGFASKIVIGEDGMPTAEYIGDDGKVVLGEYDLVPILESFIEKHPDFSYRGARATLALTGYEGVLGYRTQVELKNHEKEAEAAKKVVDAMKERGWVFASHSYGHIPFGESSVESVRADTEAWDTEVAPILGKTDIFIYPHGQDIAGLEDYGGEKYNILKAKGFKYFCNVDGSQPYWVQIHGSYVRQGRRNLDGYRMYHNPNLLKDLFEVSEVFDKARPVPVPSI